MRGHRPRVVAIVPAAGRGKRLGLKEKKPFVLLGGKPLVTYALKALEACGAVDAVIIAAEKPCIKDFEKLIARFGFKKVKEIIAGGRTRFQSVANCLKAIGTSFDIVLVHDAARPFVERKTIEDSIRIAGRFGGCVVAVPESDTVKLVDKGLFIKKTLDRARIFRAQTPQAFRFGLIKKAYASAGRGATDDAALAEIPGNRIKVLKGTRRNIKITTREDLKLAEVLL